MDQTNDIIDIQDVTVGYPNRVVQKELNFKIHRGEVFVIMGDSGCGKSTLLKHLIGLYKPMAGNILINNHNIGQLPTSELRKAQQQFGVLYQSGALFGSMTLAENVMLPLEEFTELNKSERLAKAKEKLALVNLAGFEDYYPAQISGGMKKRAGLARAMALDPELLFFDEPSAGLDPVSSAQLDQLILKLRTDLGVTVVIVSHELESIYTIADRVVMLDAQTRTMLEVGDPKKLRESSPIERVRRFLNRSI